MRAAIISLGSQSSVWTSDAMKVHFDSVDNINLRGIEVMTSPRGLVVLYEQQPVKDYDCIYLKGSFRYPLLLRSIAEAFYQKCYMPIKPEAFTIGHDKWLTHLVLQNRNVPMPQTYLCATVASAKEFLKSVTYPLVLKFPSGTQGKGVMFAESYAAASALFDAMMVLKQPVILQEYIDTNGVDIRAIVCGDRVVASMKRIAARDEQRANIHAGGTGEPYPISPTMQRVAVQTAQAIGAEICAVDMLESVKGTLVIEINLSPGLQGITKVTGINVAERLAKYLGQQARASKTGRAGNTEEVLRESGIPGTNVQGTHEIISTLDFRGNRVLLPESVTQLCKLREHEEYVLQLNAESVTVRRLRSSTKSDTSLTHYF